MHTLLAAVIVLCAACGRIGFDDLATPCERAWLTKPNISPPVLIGPGSAPFLSADGLTLYLSNARDVQSAVRASLDEPFGAPTAVASINTPTASEIHFTHSQDGLEGFLSANRSGGYDIWYSTRPSPDVDWPVFTVLPELSSTVDDYNAILSPDERIAYLVTKDSPAGAGLTDMWIATRPDRDAPFGTPSLLSELATANEEASPSLSAGARVLVFTSDRAGSVGGLDIWYATRDGDAEPFGPPRPVPIVNSLARDYTGFLRSDGCELIFASNRGGGDDELFISRVSL